MLQVKLKGRVKAWAFPFFLIMLSILAFATFLPIQVHASVITSTVDTIDTNTPSLTSWGGFQPKVYFYQELWWVFYANAYSGDYGYKTSSDGTTWSSYTVIYHQGGTTTGSSFAMSLDMSTGKYYYLIANGQNYIMYRKGTLISGGTITWDHAQVQYSFANGTATSYYPAIVVDSQQHTWLAYEYFNAGDSSHDCRAMIIENTATDGSITVASGYPYTLYYGGAAYTYCDTPLVPQTDKKIYAFINNGSISIGFTTYIGRQYDGSGSTAGWGSAVLISQPSHVDSGQGNPSVYGDDISLFYSAHISGYIYIRLSLYISGSWDSGTQYNCTGTNALGTYGYPGNTLGMRVNSTTIMVYWTSNSEGSIWKREFKNGSPVGDAVRVTTSWYSYEKIFSLLNGSVDASTDHASLIVQDGSSTPYAIRFFDESGFTSIITTTTTTSSTTTTTSSTTSLGEYGGPNLVYSVQHQTLPIITSGYIHVNSNYKDNPQIWFAGTSLDSSGHYNSSWAIIQNDVAETYQTVYISDDARPLSFTENGTYYFMGGARTPAYGQTGTPHFGVINKVTLAETTYAFPYTVGGSNAVGPQYCGQDSSGHGWWMIYSNDHDSLQVKQMDWIGGTWVWTNYTLTGVSDSALPLMPLLRPQGLVGDNIYMIGQGSGILVIFNVISHTTTTHSIKTGTSYPTTFINDGVYDVPNNVIWFSFFNTGYLVKMDATTFATTEYNFGAAAFSTGNSNPYNTVIWNGIVFTLSRDKTADLSRVFAWDPTTPLMAANIQVIECGPLTPTGSWLTNLEAGAPGYVARIFISEVNGTSTKFSKEETILSVFWPIQYSTYTVTQTPVTTLTSTTTSVSTFLNITYPEQFNLWVALILMIIPLIAFTFIGYESSGTPAGTIIGAAIGSGIGIVINVYEGNFPSWTVILVVIALVALIFARGRS